MTFMEYLRGVVIDKARDRERMRMGRWAQRRVRGGGGVPTEPAPTVFITDAQDLGANVISFNFSDAVDPSGSMVLTGLQVNGQNPTGVNFVGGPTVELTFPGPVGAGDPWVLATQPPWLLTRVIVPEDGTVASP